MNTRELKSTITEKPIVKFFKSVDSMTRYCNYRYGRDRATQILDAPRYSHVTAWGNYRECGTKYWFHTKTGKVGFEQTKADEIYSPLTDEDRVGWGHRTYKPAHLPEIDEENLAERRMEEMAAYIHSGAGLNAYFEDRDAGYAY